MSALTDLVQMLQADKKSGTDYTATVTRVEGGTAYVRLTGSDIMDTPATMSIDCKAGDKVRVRVDNGKSWITGNDTAPPTNDTKSIQKIQSELYEPGGKVSAITKIIERVGRIAANTSQYFWHTKTGTDTGVHITEVPKDTFLKDPENGGGNLLARSNGIAIRDGLTELAQFKADGIDFYDRQGANVVDIDTSDQSYLSEFANTLSFSLDGGESITLKVDDPYFLGFENYTGQSYNGVLKADSRYTIESFNVDFTDDFTVTAHLSYDDINYVDIQIAYSYADKAFTLTNLGTSFLAGGFLYLQWNARIISSSFTFGRRSTPNSKGPFSGIVGEGLDAQNPDQFAIGRYNFNRDNTMFEVGGGANEDDRQNLFEVYKTTGNVKAKGSLEVGSVAATQKNLGIYSGNVSVGTVNTKQYKDVTVNFPSGAFTEVPIIVVGFKTGSVDGIFGKCCCAVYYDSSVPTPTKNGFVIRTYNGDDYNRSPQVSWIAIGH